MSTLGQAAGSEHNREVARKILQALRSSGVLDAKEHPQEDVVRCVLNALNAVESGKGIVVVETDDCLTTQQAAGMLNVSRPFLIKLLESGKLPSRAGYELSRFHAI